MDTRENTEPPRIFPTFRYRDTAAMIDWLIDAFGLSLHAKHMDGDMVAHAELTFGSSIIMLGSATESAYGAIVGDPGENGGKSVYIAVDDVDTLCERARRASAQILEEPVDRGYGSREFICRDPEGNVWCFGTYWPKASGKTP